MKNFIKQNWFKLSIVLSLLLVVLSFTFSYTARPMINDKKQASCLRGAHNNHIERWNKYCRIDNRQIGTDGSCLLSNERAEGLIDLYENEKEDCFKRYPTR